MCKVAPNRWDQSTVPGLFRFHVYRVECYRFSMYPLGRTYPTARRTNKAIFALLYSVGSVEGGGVPCLRSNLKTLAQSGVDDGVSIGRGGLPDVPWK